MMTWCTQIIAYYLAKQQKNTFFSRYILIFKTNDYHHEFKLEQQVGIN